MGEDGSELSHLARPTLGTDYLGDALLMILFPIFFLPFSKTLFAAVDLTFRPREPGDFEQPREPAARPSGKR